MELNPRFKRRQTSSVNIGGVKIGDNAPIVVQSMLTVPTVQVSDALDQIKYLKSFGCELIRLGVPDMDSAKALKAIVKESVLPVIADIHFDHELALVALESGVHGLRLNPGNIRKESLVSEIVASAKDHNVPIRIGVNSGSLDTSFDTTTVAENMVESALHHIHILEKNNFDQIKVSLKSSHVPTMIEANRIFSNRSSYPLHLGVTEAGDYSQSIVKSSIGIGTLLSEGIGDTIRVSMTDDSAKEVQAAYHILQFLGLRHYGIELISCPTCARKEFDVIEAVKEFRKKTIHINYNGKVAIMGCAVNGPGEAKEADLGVAVGPNHAIVFKKGKVLKKIGKNEIVDALIHEILEDGGVVHES